MGVNEKEKVAIDGALSPLFGCGNIVPWHTEIWIFNRIMQTAVMHIVLVWTNIMHYEQVDCS